MCREVAPVTVSTRQTDAHPGLGRVGGIIRTERRPYSGDSAQNFRWPLGIFFYPAIPKRRGRAKKRRAGEKKAKKGSGKSEREGEKSEREG